MPRQTKQQRIDELEDWAVEYQSTIAEQRRRIESLEHLNKECEARVTARSKRIAELQRMLHRAEEHINTNRGYMRCMMDLGHSPVLRASLAGDDGPEIDSFAYEIQQGVDLNPASNRLGGDKVLDWWKS